MIVGIVLAKYSLGYVGDVQIHLITVAGTNMFACEGIMSAIRQLKDENLEQIDTFLIFKDLFSLDLTYPLSNTSIFF